MVWQEFSRQKVTQGSRKYMAPTQIISATKKGLTFVRPFLFSGFQVSQIGFWHSITG
jgi:hypothetical protein